MPYLGGNFPYRHKYLPIVAQTLPSLPKVRTTDYTIYNQQGQLVKKGNCRQGEAVDIVQLPIGNYLLKTANGDSYQFTK